MATTAEAWLDDIIAHPGDDAPRLIFADWLTDHGEEVRAAFIRVQVALARYPPAPTGLSDGFAAGRWRERRDALCRRERELLRRHAQDWIPPVSGLAVWTHFARDREPQYGWMNRPPGASGTGLPVTFRRGFVAEITCRLGDWCGGRCEQCLGRGRLDARDWRRPRECPECGGTGRTPGHGPALVRAAPLEVVTLSDKRPWVILDPPGHDPKSWWIKGDDGLSRGQHFLSGPLWDHLTGEPGTWGTCPVKAYRGENHATAAASAVADLSRALRAWANPPLG